MPQEPLETNDDATQQGDQPTAAADTVPKADFDKLNQKLDELNAKVEEHQGAAQHWYEKYEEAQAAIQERPASDRERPADEPAAAADVEAFIEALNNKGAAAIDEYVTKKGLLSADEARTLVREEAQRLFENGELVKEYPDLQNNKSDFFKAVALELKGVDKPTPREMRHAAQAVELRLRRDGKWEDPAAEAERRARAAAAAAPGAQGAAGDEAESDELTPTQKNLAEAITGLKGDKAHEAYRARAKKGVNVSVRGSLAHLARSRGGA